MRAGRSGIRPVRESVPVGEQCYAFLDGSPQRAAQTVLFSARYSGVAAMASSGTPCGNALRPSLASSRAVNGQYDQTGHTGRIWVSTEDWRSAACRGGVRLEPEAFRWAVEDHTNEASVLELEAKLAASGRRVVARRPPDGGGVPIASPGAPEAGNGKQKRTPHHLARPWTASLAHGCPAAVNPLRGSSTSFRPYG